ncbi:MAG: zinc-ribbon domain-containing protein [Clostridia bacterium]|nr:zinc-ribbon domain-containing protein [Clostridia bacterium]
MFCTNCGRSLPDAAKFCPYCGKALKPRQTAPAAQQSRSAPVQPVPVPRPQTPAPQQTPAQRYTQKPQVPVQTPQYAPRQQAVSAPPAYAARPAQVPVQQAPVDPQNCAMFTGNGFLFNGALYAPDRIEYRVKCPSCGHIQNAKAVYTCPKCKKQQAVDFINSGYLYYYRMGNYFSSNVAAVIWLNGEQYGGVGNTESALLPLAPGEYQLQIGIRGVKKSEVIPIQVERGKVTCVKTSLVVHGFSNYTKLFLVDPREMPGLY